MSAQVMVSEGPDVIEHAERLGCNVPERFSIVPSGLEEASSTEELVLDDEAITIRKLIGKEGVSETPIDEGLDLYTTKHRSAEIAFPVLFITHHLLLDNWGDVVTIIETIKQYLEYVNKDTVSLSVLIQDEENSTTKVDYEGPAEELDEVLDTIEELNDG